MKLTAGPLAVNHFLNQHSSQGSIQPVLRVTTLQAYHSHKPSLPSQVPILPLGGEKQVDNCLAQGNLVWCATYLTALAVYSPGS